MIMGRVTYLHHYLPTLYFAVIMSGLLIDHSVFTSRRLSERTKWIVFWVITSALVGTWWWFRDIAFGIEGPIGDQKGLLWRKVSNWILL